MPTWQEKTQRLVKETQAECAACYLTENTSLTQILHSELSDTNFSIFVRLTKMLRDPCSEVTACHDLCLELMLMGFRGWVFGPEDSRRRLQISRSGLGFVALGCNGQAAGIQLK